MSDLSSERKPEILVNGEEEQQDAADAPGDERSEERVVSAGRETQMKVQSVFQQVRQQIRSQAGEKSSIQQLVQRVRDRETERVNADAERWDGETKSEAGGQDVRREETQTYQRDPKEEELCALLEEKLEASKKALKDEFEVQISQVSKEMQAYTDRALKDLECKMQSRKPKPAAAATTATPSLASRRGRVLTRTMTTINPKTCTPVIVGPRAKSESLSSSKRESGRLVLRDPLLSLQSRRPLPRPGPPLPAAGPPLPQCKKPIGPKTKTGN